MTPHHSDPNNTDRDAELAQLVAQLNDVSLENEELRAHVQALTNTVNSFIDAQPPSYTAGSTFPVTRSLDSAILNPGPASGRRNTESRPSPPHPLAPAAVPAFTISPGHSQPTATRAPVVADHTSNPTVHTSSSNHGAFRRSRSDPAYIAQSPSLHAPNSNTREVYDRIMINVYGPASYQVPQSAPSQPTAVPSHRHHDGSHTVEIPDANPTRRETPLPVPVGENGIALHVRTPLRYKTPLPLMKPPGASSYKGKWYVVTAGYGTGVFKYRSIAINLTTGASSFLTNWKSHDTWESADAEYRDAWSRREVVLIHCPEAKYQAALADSD